MIIVGFARLRFDSYREHAVRWTKRPPVHPNLELPNPVTAVCGQACRYVWNVPFILDKESESCPRCIKALS